jgi:hypothetical protein
MVGQLPAVKAKLGRIMGGDNLPHPGFTNHCYFGWGVTGNSKWAPLYNCFCWLRKEKIYKRILIFIWKYRKLYITYVSVFSLWGWSIPCKEPKLCTNASHCGAPLWRWSVHLCAVGFGSKLATLSDTLTSWRCINSCSTPHYLINGTIFERKKKHT